MKRPVALVVDSPVDAIRKILEALPDEAARISVLDRVLENRCRKCLDHDPRGHFWCCQFAEGAGVLAPLPSTSRRP